MPTAPIPDNESNRIMALQALNILDTPPEERFDRITRLAAKFFDTPMAWISFVDPDRQWFKSCQGLEISEISRSVSFCAHTILQDEALIISDTREDPRFADLPMVTEAPHIVFYAGCPLATTDGSKVGTLCLADHQSRTLSAEEIETLKDLAEMAKTELSLAEADALRAKSEAALRQTNMVVENSPAVLFRWQAAEGWPVVYVSENIRQFGYTPEELLSGTIPYATIVHPDDLERVAQEVADHSASGVEEFTQEYRLLTRDGEVRWTDDRTVIERDAEGNITHYQGIVLDITERRQAKQAAELQTVAEVSTTVATILDEQVLLHDVVDLTKELFGLYHVDIYLLDEAGETLKLAAGSGEIGQMLVQEGWHIPVDHEYSIVALAAQNREATLVNDVQARSEFLATPRLPDTRSQIAIPMVVGDTLLGVLDVRADSVDHFTEQDKQVQITLASQVAVALQNARQYQQTQAALAEVQAVQRRYIIGAWQDYSARTQQKGFEKVDEIIAPLAEGHLPPEAHQAIVEKKVVVKGDDPQTGLADDPSAPTKMVVPLTIRDEVIGVLDLEDPADNQPWTAEEIDLVRAIVEQMAQSAENLRLFDETRERANFEQTVSGISQKLRQAPNMEALAKTAAEELAQALGVSHSLVKVGKDSRGQPSRTPNS